MNLIVSNSAQTSFAISRALNCTDRTDGGEYTNDTGSIVIATVEAGLIAPLPLQGYANGGDFIKELPFIPKDYKFGIRQDYADGKCKVLPEDEAAAQHIFALIAEAREVVFASNGGSETQALFSMLCKMAQAGQKISRMWLTTLSNRAINFAYRRRESGRNITRIARSGLVQLGMDFLYRTNIEQAFAQAYGKGAFPMERMDIPALWLLCNKFDQMKKQRPAKTQYEVHICGKFNGHDIRLFPAEVWDSKAEAQYSYLMLQEHIGSAVTALVEEVTPKVEWACKPFDLGDLQVHALIECGYLPAKTMEVADALFVKGLISSPRTSVSALPKHLERHIVRRFPQAKGYQYLPDESIPYCHGLLTTERTPMFLTDDEQRLYNLIANRMEAVFSPTRCVEVGMTVTIAGIDFYGMAELPEGSECELGDIELKLTGAGVGSFSEYRPTTLTASMFLTMLDTLVNDGTDSPRLLPVDGYNDCGACLQRLIDNGLVNYVMDDIEPTEKARVAMMHTAHLDLADIGKFISQVEEVDALAENRQPTKPVMTAYEDWIHSQTLSLIVDPKMFSRRFMEHKCPKCGNHGLTAYPATVTCECCGFAIPLHYKGHDLTDKDVEQLLKYKYTSPIYDFVGRKGRKFCESLVLDYRHGITFADKSAKIY